MPALTGGCPAALRWTGRRLRTTTMLRDVRSVGTAAAARPRVRAAAWPAAAGMPPPASRRVGRALPCARCDTARPRWYAAKPSDDAPSSSSIAAPAHIQRTETPPAKDEPLPEPGPTEPGPKEPTPPPAASGADADAGAASSLPSFVEARRSALSARFSRFMDDLQTRFVSASQTLSDLTGYTAIERIKAHNAQLEADLAAAQADLRVARRAYQAVNERRAATQREVTTLLARKDSWAPPDLERFTALYRQDHELETSAQRAVEHLKEAEADEQRLSTALTSGILKRYHEEQVWSDRIRRQSTWGTWGLMGLNVVLFLVLQVIAEPWRRRRLMRGIAEAESGALEAVRKDLADVREALAAGAVAAAPAAGPAVSAAVPVELAPSEPSTPPAPAPAPPLDSLPAFPLRLHLSLSWPASWHDVVAAGPSPARCKAWLADLFSERTVHVRMRDVSMVAVQSACAGAALVGALALALR